MPTGPKPGDKPSFITEARRAQMIEAAIVTLDEIGFANASLAQIAKRAGVSTALLSYHFQDKNDLMDHTLFSLLQQLVAYVGERVQTASTAREKLHAFIAAHLAYQGTRPKHNAALLEIIFHARTPDNVPYYKLDDGDEDPMAALLAGILTEGQASGEFGSFLVPVMASAIQGAIGEQMAGTFITSGVDLETYTTELIRLFDKALAP